MKGKTLGPCPLGPCLQPTGIRASYDLQGFGFGQAGEDRSENGEGKIRSEKTPVR